MSLKSAVNKAQAAEKDAELATEDLAKTLKPDAAYIKLDRAVSAVMLDVFNHRVEHGVTVSYATPAKLSAGGSISKLSALAEEVPGMKQIKSVRINVIGTYETYQGLLSYLKSLQGLPVAIVRLKVQDQSFEVALRVYGNET